MSVSALTAALLLAASPVNTDEFQSAGAPLPAAPPTAEPAPSPVTPVPGAGPTAPSPAAPPPPAISDGGEIIVTGDRRVPKEDPLQALNAVSYGVTQAADKVVVAPLAKGYSSILPSPIRAGIRHFFNNLAEPVVALNYLLQLKPGKAAETVGRFGINSTVGVAGLIDVAKKKPFNLPLRRNGFANTLGYYGIGPGPFLFLPLVGPTTIRDLIGLTIDRAIVPAAIGKPFNKPYYALPATIIGSLDYRVEFDEQLRQLREAPNPYAASRANYLQNRQAEIDALHGRAPATPPTRTGPLVTPAPDDTKPTEPLAGSTASPR